MNIVRSSARTTAEQGTGRATPLISAHERAVSARMDHDDLISITAAATIVGRTTRTLRGWADTGRLTVFRGPGGRRWFRRAEVEALRPVPVAAPEGRKEGGACR